MEESVSAIFVNDRQKILVLKRAAYKKHYPAAWDSVVGKLEENEAPEDCLRREAKEELGITQFKVLKRLPKQIYEDAERRWQVNLFLCQIKKGAIRLNKEHTAHKWVKRNQLSDCISPLKKDLIALFES